jgi:hypothetical protein
MAVDRINMRFAGIILKEEWNDFEKRHRDTIERRIYSVQKKQSTGTLRIAREYETKTNDAAMQSVATLKHPDYERFIDMKKKHFGKRGGYGIFQNREVLYRKKGIPIHNRIIWGKLNPISFRLMHELRVQVTENVRKAFSGKQLTLDL